MAITQKKVAKLLGPVWAKYMWKQFKRPYMKKLRRYVRKRRSETTVYPEDTKTVFRAFRETQLDEVKVVILGQDPYHDGSADGLAFSNSGGTMDNISPSLKNILKEVENDVGFKSPAPDPDLSRWAEQGVLLLNTALTVEEGQAGSHCGIGWEQFTKRAVYLCSEKQQPVVFILWGNHAKNFAQTTSPNTPVPVDPFVDNEILRAYHPSPLSASRGFFGCEHFSKTNKYLKKYSLEPIDW